LSVVVEMMALVQVQIVEALMVVVLVGALAAAAAALRTYAPQVL
jgi:hypothetical protein